MRIVHAADLHIDSPMRGLSRYDGAPAATMRGATRVAMTNLINLCLEERADLLLLAGDVFDGDWKDYSTGLFFQGELSRLREIGAQVVTVRGNHDALNVVTRGLKPLERVRELDSARPETVVFDSLGVAVHGQSFGGRVEKGDLAENYPPLTRDVLNIGLLHTSLDGRPGHEPYAPTTLAVLKSKGYDYWALGHVHAREVISTEPWVVFPGNLQGRHARETGEKGATLITAENGRIMSVEARVIDAARWAHVSVVLAEEDNFDDALAKVRAALEDERERAADRTLAVRVSISGTAEAYADLVNDQERAVAEIRALGSDLGGMWVEKIVVSVRPRIDLDAITKRDDGAGAFVRAVRALEHATDAEVQALTKGLEELERKLPAELKRDGLSLTSPKNVRVWLADLERTLLPRMLGEDR